MSQEIVGVFDQGLLTAPNSCQTPLRIVVASHDRTAHGNQLRQPARRCVFILVHPLQSVGGCGETTQRIVFVGSGQVHAIGHFCEQARR